MGLESFFNPRSVAIVGASRQEGKVGYEILANMLEAGYKGKIFPVNPKADEIEGLKCYADLESIPEAPELVLVIVPPKIVPAVMQQCAKVGSKAVVIIIGVTKASISSFTPDTSSRHVPAKDSTSPRTSRWPSCTA